MQQLELFPPDDPPADGDEATLATTPAIEPARGPCGRRPRLEDLDAEAARLALAERITHLLPAPLVSLALTDNRSTLLSAQPREDEGGIALRLHWSFLYASEDTLRAVAVLLTDPRRGAIHRQAKTVVRTHVAAWQERSEDGTAPEEVVPVLDRRRRRPRRPAPRGAVHDLAAIRDEVNRDYFEDRLEVAITWGRGGFPRRRSRRSTVNLGTWSAGDNLVRIHPLLDHPDVPRFVVASVVHHEMLHADLGSVMENGRRRVHTPEFRRRERQFEHHDATQSWIRANLPRLLERRRRRRRRGD